MVARASGRCSAGCIWRHRACWQQRPRRGSTSRALCRPRAERLPSGWRTAVTPRGQRDPHGGRHTGSHAPRGPELRTPSSRAARRRPGDLAHRDCDAAGDLGPEILRQARGSPRPARQRVVTPVPSRPRLRLAALGCRLKQGSGYGHLALARVAPSAPSATPPESVPAVAAHRKCQVVVGDVRAHAVESDGKPTPWQAASRTFPW